MSTTFVLYIQPFLSNNCNNNYNNNCYKNIVTVNVLPKGPLANIIRKVKLNPLSEFKEPRFQKCALGLLSIRDCNNYGNLMCADEIPELFSFLLENGYKIDTSITKMINNNNISFHSENANKLVCFVTYIA